MSRPPSPSCLDCGNALPIIFGRSSQHVECLHCGSSFVVYFSTPERFQIARRLSKLERTESLAETFPECPFDFAAGIRERIVEDVALHGLAYRCMIDAANAFHDWSDAQIDEWLNRNNLLMRRHHDGGWLFRSRHTHDLSEFESAVRERAPEMVENYYRMVNESIRAEVEAMDWPEVIDD